MDWRRFLAGHLLPARCRSNSPVQRDGFTPVPDRLSAIAPHRLPTVPESFQSWLVLEYTPGGIQNLRTVRHEITNVSAASNKAFIIVIFFAYPAGDDLGRAFAAIGLEACFIVKFSIVVCRTIA